MPWSPGKLVLDQSLAGQPVSSETRSTGTPCSVKNFVALGRSKPSIMSNCLAITAVTSMVRPMQSIQRRPLASCSR